jgi:hypothetical protein
MRPLGVGDINGDGYADVVQANTVGGNPGDTFFSVHPGSAGGIGKAPVLITNPEGFNSTLLASGDMNGDGFSDLTAWYGWVNPSGKFHEHLGSSAGIATSPATTIDSGFTASILFNALRGAGDVNKDGYEDLLIGSYGKATLYLGGMGGLSAASLQKVMPPAGASPEFGASLAGSGAGK